MSVFTVAPTDFAMCRCGHRRGNHAGRTGAGGCLDCVPCGRFQWQSEDRLRARAQAAAAEHPSRALNSWDASRHRSGKTRRARKAGQWGVGPSDHSTCQRQIEYRERPPEGYEPKWINKDAAHLGTMVDAGFKTARRHRYPWRKFGIRVVPPGLDRPGELDEWDPIIGRVTDYKSVKDGYGWDLIGKRGGKAGDWKQVLEYALALEEEGHTMREVELVYVNRNTGRVEAFVRAYDRAVALAAVAELHAIVDALESGRTLPRVRDGEPMLGPTVNTLCREWCPAVGPCWGLDEVPKDRTPEGWLLVRDDADVEEALIRYDEARADVKEAKDRQNYEKVLLEGIQSGRYGDNTLSWPPATPRADTKARVAQLEREMVTAIEQGKPPPDPVDLPWPTFTPAPSINVRPVRKAKLEQEQAEKTEEAS